AARARRDDPQPVRQPARDEPGALRHDPRPGDGARAARRRGDRRPGAGARPEEAWVTGAAARPGDAPLLAVDSVSVSFGGVRAVVDASLAVPAGAICALIGPNGAGETTLFATISGFQRPDSGTVSFQGHPITGLAPHRICRLGIGRTFQIVQPFAGQTVLENIAVGSHLHRASRTEALAHAASVAQRLGLGPLLDRDAAALPIAQRKRLEVAKALATEPTLLLLDEVLAGLNPAE